MGYYITSGKILSVLLCNYMLPLQINQHIQEEKINGSQIFKLYYIVKV